MLRQLVKDGPTRYELGRIEAEVPGIVAQQIDAFINSGRFTFEFRRDTINPAALTVPMNFSVYVWNRQASGLGDIVYLSLQKSTGVWAWFQLLKAT